METVGINILQIIAAHDPGKDIIPVLVAGLLNDGVVRALGGSTSETFIVEEGRIKTDKISTCLVPTAKDVPDTMDLVLCQTPDDGGCMG